MTSVAPVPIDANDPFTGLPDLDAFRTSVRSWVEANAPDGLADLVDWRARADLPGSVGNRVTPEAVERAMQADAFREWEKRCLDAGLVCPTWPLEYGGRDWHAPEMTVLDEEFFRAGVPRIDRVQGETMVGPSIMLHGTDSQKAELLPPIHSGQHVYCQGFSEPGAGSDLASATTRGELVGDEVIITGQKVWTSRWAVANMIFVLCRTDREAPKHKGLSYVILPFTPGENGIEVRPIRQMSGGSEFAEVFFDGTRARQADIIGGPGNGWRVVQSTLSFERAAAGRATTQLLLARERELTALIQTAGMSGQLEVPWVRRELAWARMQVRLLRASWERTVDEVREGVSPGPQVAAWKLMWSEYHVRLGEIALAIRGRDSLIRPSGPGYAVDPWQEAALVAHSGTIYAGTSEIQRNIIGEAVLGLPREQQVEARS